MILQHSNSRTLVEHRIHSGINNNSLQNQNKEIQNETTHHPSRSHYPLRRRPRTKYPPRHQSPQGRNKGDETLSPRTQGTHRDPEQGNCRTNP
jgi:hypothetical protein